MTAEKLAPFNGRKYLSLETLRKNGAPVATPIWFAESGGVFYAYSLAESGKIKRIRNNSHVRIAPCDSRGKIQGEWLAAVAVLLEGGDVRRANDLLNQKYGWQKRMLDLLARLRPRKRAYLAISLHASV